MLNLKKHLDSSVNIITFAVGKTVKFEDLSYYIDNLLKIN